MGKLQYRGWGDIVLMKRELKPKKKCFLIAAGTGITPLLSVALASVYAQDGMDIKLVFSNKTKHDILCLDDINAL